MSKSRSLLIAGVVLTIIIVVLVIVYRVMYAKDAFDRMIYLIGSQSDNPAIKQSIEGFVGKNKDWAMHDITDAELIESYDAENNIRAVTIEMDSIVSADHDTTRPPPEGFDKRAMLTRLFPQMIRRLADRFLSAINGRSGVWIFSELIFSLSVTSLEGLPAAIEIFRCKRNKERIMLYNSLTRKLVCIKDAVYIDIQNYICLTK